MVVFPAFRSEDWIKSLTERPLVAPTEVLHDAELQPEHMERFPSAHMYAKKAEQVRQQIRSTLFKQAIFKIQNVEVMHNCKDSRELMRVSRDDHCFDLWRVLDAAFTEVLRKELWDIDRCGKKVSYEVTFLKEGGDGFSTRVVPRSFLDKYNLFKFYYA